MSHEQINQLPESIKADIFDLLLHEVGNARFAPPFAFPRQKLKAPSNEIIKRARLIGKRLLAKLTVIDAERKRE